MNEFIEWDSLDFGSKSTGEINLLCPICSHTRKKKTLKCLGVNLSKGLGRCNHCEAITVRKDIEQEYELPEQEFKNYTNLSDRMVNWFKNKRHISQKTLQDLNITEEKYYQPQVQREANNFVFNYFEGEIIVNKKYRTEPKAFTQSKGGKPIFYNLNALIGLKEAYIVEGEMDVLAMHEIGIKNVVSLPNGANDNDTYWENSKKYIEGIEKFIIAVDNDEKGNAIKEKIAQRLGRYRCEYLEFEHKDANGELINGTLRRAVKEIKKFPVSGTFTVDDLYDGILDLYDNGLPKTIYPKHGSFGDLKDYFSVMRGHLVTITGIPSHGKSAFSEWYVLNLINDYKMKASFFSPEHSPMSLHQTNFIQKAIGRNFWKDTEGLPRISKIDIVRYKEWANEKLYLTAPDRGETPTWDWILDKFKEQMYSFGVDIFVIDAFNKLQLPKGNKLDEINNILTKLTNFAQANNVIVFLVAHPKKMNKTDGGTYDYPTLYDVSGSADFRNQTHDGFCVYRNFGEDNNFSEFVNLKTKHSFQGEIGKKVEFEYHIPSGRYYPRRHTPPTFDMTKPKEEEKEKKEESININNRIESNSNFDNEVIDDAPF